ncbi:MAG: lactate racemase domain-containing protein [Synergistales bacterium]|nr:lactate racemase domain-containing protein [Synergistales bacterium]
MEVLTVRQGRETIRWETDLPMIHPRTSSEQVPMTSPAEALASPIGSPGLAELASQARHVAVVLPDATRGWQRVPDMAEPLREELERGEPKDVTWVIGGGQHRPATEEEIDGLLRHARREDDLVVVHDPGLVESLDCSTSRGTPVAVAPEVAEADLVVVVGGINYHDLAGFSGGRKGVIPGVSATGSIQHNHALGLTGEGFHATVTGGVREGNPVHEDMMEFLNLVFGEDRRGFLLNTVNDREGTPATHVAGDPVEAWEEGIRRAVVLQSLYVDAPCGMAVVSSGGYPQDIELYQSTKALTAVYDALTPDAGIVLVAGLQEGMGTEIFGHTMRLAMEDFHAAMEELRADFTIPAYIAVKTVYELRDRRCALVTPSTEVAFPGLITESLTEAVDHVQGEGHPDSVLYVPSGNVVHAMVAG